MASLKLSVTPTVEPISVDDAAEWIRLVEPDANDPVLTRLIKAARREAEKISGYQLCTATFILYLEAFPLSADTPIRLPRPPLSSVTSIVYTSTAGTSTTWTASEYRVSNAKEPAEIYPAYGYTWPTARSQQEAVAVTYVAGYGGADDVPEDVTQLLLALVGFWYDQPERQAELPAWFTTAMVDRFHGCRDLMMET